MIYKNNYLLVFVVFTSIIMLLGYCFARPKSQEEKETKMVIAKNNDAVVRAECIKTNTGSTVGFRIEVINLNTDKDIVLTVRDNISYLFDVRLINEGGMDISPRLPDMKKKSPNKTYRYDRIFPETSHSWFVPVPNQVRADPIKFTNDNNLQVTPKGEYMVEIRVNVGYFTQDKEVESIPKYPDFQVLRLTLPRISISVDPNLFNLDIIKTYTGSVNK